MSEDNGMDRPVDTVMPSLLEANHIVNGERQDDYGRPAMSFERIASLWTCYLNHFLTPRDVAMMMVLLKVARGHTKRDNLIDVIGYASIAADRL